MGRDFKRLLRKSVFTSLKPRFQNFISVFMPAGGLWEQHRLYKNLRTACIIILTLSIDFEMEFWILFKFYNG